MILKKTSLSSLQWLGIGLLISSCATHDTARNATEKRAPKIWPQMESAFDPSETAAINVKVDALLAQMSLTEKVGQMVQGEMSRTTPEDVRKYRLGSVLTGGGGLLNNDKNATAEAWVDALDEYYNAAKDTSHGGLAIPIIWGIDAVHGHNKIKGATTFPHHVGLGATGNAELVEKIAAVTALQVLATGMDWTFAPSLSVVRDDRWGRSYEGFSEDPQLVSSLGAAAVRGFQGSLAGGTFMGPDRIMATAKHYIADGGTENGIDRGNNRSSEEELIRLHAAPYFAALREGVLSVMVSHSSWQGTRMHGEKYLIRDILKGRLGFDGFVVGDWNSHGLVEGCTNTHCPAAINAGVDMLMVPYDWKEFIDNTVADVEQGRIPLARIDDAVRRILRSKFRAGIMDSDKPSARQFANRADLLASDAHRQLARQAVRESLVLLKNNDNLLPLNPRLRVLVTGEGADNIAMQNGGWTISWQGTDNTNADFPKGTSILQAIRTVVEAAGGQVEYAPDGKFRTQPDVAIAVYGEAPYAEWQGDRRHVGYQLQEQTDAKILATLQQQGIKTVSVFMSGRPLWVNPELNASDAFVAAWLPGTEGAGVTDLLFKDRDGNMPFSFTGKLAYSWPAEPGQTAVNAGDKDYAPLFPFGYGLTYGDTVQVSTLDTTYQLDESQQDLLEIIYDGQVQEPWGMYIFSSDQKLIRYHSGVLESGPLIVSEADKETQGDAVRAKWEEGDDQTHLILAIINSSRNIAGIVEENGALSFDIRPHTRATGTVSVGMGCGGGSCSPPKVGRVDMTTLINTSPLNEWNRQSISLKCFADQSVAFEEISVGFAMTATGDVELDLANVAVEPGLGDKAGIQCQ